jgi:hypothetical protein
MSVSSAQKSWATHYQIEWENWAADTKLPLWLRISCLAYGRHEANGHATFGRGQLSWILGTPPTADHPFKRIDKYTVRDTIKLATGHGWLAEGSCSSTSSSRLTPSTDRRNFSRWMSPSGVKRLLCGSPGWCYRLVG